MEDPLEEIKKWKYYKIYSFWVGIKIRIAVLLYKIGIEIKI